MKISIIIFIISLSVYGQNTPYADSVVYFHKGIGEYSNQNPPYFPYNILDEPSRTATDTIPETSPYEICSLGLGGEILLKFTDNGIINGEGYDFTVFENPFIILYGARAGEIFAEPGKVAVSKDGINFYEFPFDSLTLEGLAGKTPTHGYADPTNPDSSGGDTFDLSVVGLDTAFYVKITDVTEIITDPAHPFFDPTANGFDLDAVVAIHSANVNDVISHSENSVSAFSVSLPFPNPVSKSEKGNFGINVKAKGKVSFTIYNILGKILLTENIYINGNNERMVFPLKDFPSGIYLLKASNNGNRVTRKIVVLK